MTNEVYLPFFEALKIWSRLTKIEIDSFYDLPKLATALTAFGQFGAAEDAMKWYKNFHIRVGNEYGEVNASNAQA